ncbi:MAG: restriction endonuclease subunit S [Victivallales bacterium]|nr:restriction endonuclease subunit S [Victivallales bacterium]
MKRYPHYKPSGIKWIGDVPEHWKAGRLFSAAHEHYISNKNIHNQNLLSLSYGRIIRKDINTTDGLLPASFDGYQVVEPNNVVLRLTDLQNDHRSLRVGFAKEKGIITSAYLCLAPRKNIVPQYLYLYLHTNDVHKVFYGMGGGLRQSLDYSELRKLTLLIPSHDEQQNIVAFLDLANAKINKYIAAKQSEIEKLGILKQAIISRTITRGLNPNAPMKPSGIAWIGDVPSHWKKERLFSVAYEHVISNKNAHNQNLLSLSYGKIKRKDINTTDGLLPASFDGYQVVEPDNVILRLTDLQNDHRSLRVGFVTETGIITSAYLCLASRDNIIPKYLYLFLHINDIHKVFYSMGGGLRQSLDYSELRKLSILIPPLDEQQAIVDYIDRKVGEIDKYISKVQEQIEKLKLYKQRLISDAVTGKIDVRDSVARSAT